MAADRRPSPASAGGCAPLGQHTRAVLQVLLRLDDAPSDGLAQRGVVA